MQSLVFYYIWISCAEVLCFWKAENKTLMNWIVSFTLQLIARGFVLFWFKQHPLKTFNRKKKLIYPIAVSRPVKWTPNSTKLRLGDLYFVHFDGVLAVGLVQKLLFWRSCTEDRGGPRALQCTAPSSRSPPAGQVRIPTTGSETWGHARAGHLPELICSLVGHFRKSSGWEELM